MNEFHLGEPVWYIKYENEKDWLLYRNAGFWHLWMDVRLLSYDSSFFVFGKYMII